MRDRRGLVAQWIERLRPKEGVGGSSPSEAAKARNVPTGHMDFRRHSQEVAQLLEELFLALLRRHRLHTARWHEWRSVWQPYGETDRRNHQSSRLAVHDHIAHHLLRGIAPVPQRKFRELGDAVDRVLAKVYSVPLSVFRIDGQPE